MGNVDIFIQVMKTQKRFTLYLLLSLRTTHHLMISLVTSMHQTSVNSAILL